MSMPIARQDIQMPAPISGLEWAAIYSPLVLIPLGGLIGGVLGGIAVAVNLAVSKSAMPVPVRWLTYAGTFGVAFTIALTLCLAIVAMMAGM